LSLQEVKVFVFALNLSELVFVTDLRVFLLLVLAGKIESAGGQSLCVCLKPFRIGLCHGPSCLLALGLGRKD